MVRNCCPDSRPAAGLPVLVVLLLGLFGVQMQQAALQPLWLDESFALTFAQLPLSELMHRLATNEPQLPPYFLALRAWEQLAGPAPVAERLPSVACAVLTAALLWKAGVTLAGRPAAWLAIVLWCVQPEGFWYSQEVRMYAPLSLGAAASVLLFVRAMKGRPWLPVALALLATAWMHYAGVLLAIAVAVAGVCLSRTRRQAALSVLASALPAATLLPWMLQLHLVTAAKQPVGAVSEQVLGVLRGLVFGFGGPALPGPLVVVGIAMTLGAALLAMLSRRRELQLPALLLIVPLLATLLPGPPHMLFNERYLSFLAPVICLLWAALGASLWQASRPAALGLVGGVAALSGVGLSVVLAPSFHRWHDYPAAMAYVRAHGRPGQVLVNNSGTDPTAAYYYQQVDGGTLPVVLLPSYHHDSVQATEQVARGLGQRYVGAWLVLDANGDWDGDRVAQRSLAALYLPAQQQQFRDVTAIYYATPRGIAVQHPLASPPQFANGVELAGYGAVRRPTGWYIGLAWKATGRVDRDYTVFVHLLDSAGRLAAQHDGPPDDGRAPTSSWQPGGTIYDLREVPVAAGSVARLEVGLYDAQSGQRVAIAGHGDALSLPLSG